MPLTKKQARLIAREQSYLAAEKKFEKAKEEFEKDAAKARFDAKRLLNAQREMYSKIFLKYQENHYYGDIPLPMASSARKAMEAPVAVPEVDRKLLPRSLWGNFGSFPYAETMAWRIKAFYEDDFKILAVTERGIYFFYKHGEGPEEALTQKLGLLPAQDFSHSDRDISSRARMAISRSLAQMEFDEFRKQHMNAQAELSAATTAATKASKESRESAEEKILAALGEVFEAKDQMEKAEEKLEKANKGAERFFKKVAAAKRDKVIFLPPDVNDE